MTRLTKRVFDLLLLVLLGEIAVVIAYLLWMDIQVMIAPHQPANLIADRWMLTFFFTVVLYFIISKMITVIEKAGIIK